MESRESWPFWTKLALQEPLKTAIVKVDHSYHHSSLEVQAYLIRFLLKKKHDDSRQKTNVASKVPGHPLLHQVGIIEAALPKCKEDESGWTCVGWNVGENFTDYPDYNFDISR